MRAIGSSTAAAFAIATLAVTMTVRADSRDIGHTAVTGAPSPPLESLLEINDLAMGVADNGVFALDQHSGSARLEYPRGTGRMVAYAGGFWVSGRVNGDTRMVVSDFGSEWAAGPLAPGLAAPWTDGVFRFTRGDTTGRAAWMSTAVPLGAPAEPIADQTLWAICNDMAAPSFPPNGGRRTSPIGLEARFTAYAFDRPGTLRRAVFMRLRIIHGGIDALDSAAVGVFFDPKASPPALRASYDLVRDLGYSHPADDPSGEEAVAVGVLWLGGPRASPAERMRPTSFVAYPNGSDPGTAAAYDAVTRGLEPWGAAMIDSSTLQPTTFFSSGDPIAGTGWNATVPAHPHTVMAAQPFTFAPGDTQDVEVAIVVGHGTSRDAAILDLREVADEARAAYASGFANLPDPDPYPSPGRLLAFPNPAPAAARIAIRVEAPGARVEATVFDAAGRRVRRLLDAPSVSGRHVVDWDGADDDGVPAGAGLYFVRVRVGDREFTARVVRLSGT